MTARVHAGMWGGQPGGQEDGRSGGPALARMAPPVRPSVESAWACVRACVIARVCARARVWSDVHAFGCVGAHAVGRTCVWAHVRSGERARVNVPATPVHLHGLNDASKPSHGRVVVLLECALHLLSWPVLAAVLAAVRLDNTHIVEARLGLPCVVFGPCYSRREFSILWRTSLYIERSPITHGETLRKSADIYCARAVANALSAIVGKKKRTVVFKPSPRTR